MVEAASLALAGSVNEEEKKDDLVYPRLTRIREISANIAVKVIRTAQEEVRVPYSKVSKRLESEIRPILTARRRVN
jgi:malate dehydrogenase (oxaloacetate-decarboxylating)(NADP+)